MLLATSRVNRRGRDPHSQRPPQTSREAHALPPQCQPMCARSHASSVASPACQPNYPLAALTAMVTLLLTAHRSAATRRTMSTHRKKSKNHDKSKARSPHPWRAQALVSQADLICSVEYTAEQIIAVFQHEIDNLRASSAAPRRGWKREASARGFEATMRPMIKRFIIRQRQSSALRPTSTARSASSRRGRRSARRNPRSSRPRSCARPARLAEPRASGSARPSRAACPRRCARRSPRTTSRFSSGCVATARHRQPHCARVRP